MVNIKEALITGSNSCIIHKQSNTYTIRERSIKELYVLYSHHKGFLKGASFAGKTVNKATAALLALGGAKYVYAQTISSQALEILENKGITVEYEKEVPVIFNIDRSDWCPMEKLCFHESTLKGIVEKIKSFVSKKKIQVIGLLFLSLFMNKMYADNEEGNTSLSDSTAHVIDEYTITGTRSEVEVRQLPLSISIVSSQQINDRNQASVLPVLNEQVPGLFISSSSVMGYGVGQGASGSMRMRGIGGSPTTGLLMLIDGEPQYMGLMGHPIADIYQSMMAERVEVVRGPASMLYGSNAMGGVINIVTPKMKKDTMITKAKLSYGSFNTLESGFFNRYQKGKFNSKVAINYNRTDGHRDNMDFDQLSGSGKLGYKFNSNWQMYLDLNLTNYNYSNPGTDIVPMIDNDSHIIRGMSSLSLNNDFDKSSGAVKLFHNWGKHDIDDGYETGESPKDYHFNSKDQTSGIIAYQTFSPIKNNHITVGADLFRFGGKAWNAFDSYDFTIADTSEYEVATYVDVRQSVRDFLTFDAGIRYDYHSQTGAEWIPQIGVSAHLPSSIELKGMVSKGFRNPTLRELYMFGSKNPDLKAESILNYELSFQQKLFQNALSYTVNVFYLDGKNLIQTINRFNVNTGEVENYGLEISANYNINEHWNSNFNYSWLEMKEVIVAAPQHKLYAGINYHKEKLKISSGLQYINGLYLSNITEEQENFLLWNVRASYQIINGINIFARGENLLNQSYEINEGYAMPGANAYGGISISF